jgi:Ankyrin repeats (many copies)
MDTLPLPPRPDLAQYRKRAKELVKAAKSPDDDAVRVWGTAWLKTLSTLRGGAISPFVRESLDRAVDEIGRRVREKSAAGRFTLADAQYLIARAHSFASWREFAEHVEQLSGQGADADPFESAADAVVTGDLPMVTSLLRANPELIQARSAREHRATLLHYVAANGVEDFRQLTPPNAVAIATTLLEAGADVDALANTYGGGRAQTTMNLLVSSVHPAAAGLQPALVEALLDFDAAVDGLDDDGSPLMTALAFGHAEAAETLARRGARIDNVIAAAALGRVELVRHFVAEGGGAVSPSLLHLYWLRLNADPQSQLDRAFVWACAFGRTMVVEFLLDHGVDPEATDDDAMTGLHWAAANGHLEVVQVLIERGAPLEARNRWGGTVLDSTTYFARQSPDWARHSVVMETLIAAGADVSAVPYPTGNQFIDELLVRHGASASRPG